MRRATLALSLVVALLAAAAPADAFLLEFLSAKFGGASSAKATAAAAAPAAEPVAVTVAVAAAAAPKPAAAAPRPLLAAAVAAKPAVAAAVAAKPASVAAMAKPAVAAMAKPAAMPAVAAASSAAASASSAACPPKNFDSAANFDLSRYIDGRWYTFAQRPVSYQPPESLFCVTALYTLEDEAKGAEGGVTVRNYSNRGGVNGESMGTSGAGGPEAPSRVGGPPAGAEPFSMIALPHPVGGPNSTNPATAASKLIVGPKAFLQGAPLPVLARMLGPTYQVVAFDEDSYEWAIVISGKPDVEGKDGLCKFGGDSGFWLFSREQVPSEETVAAVQEAAKAVGLDTSDLTPVPQEGCEYEGAK